MKLQIIILSLLIVCAFAWKSEKSDSDIEAGQRRRQYYRGQNRDNKIAAEDSAENDDEINLEGPEEDTGSSKHSYGRRKHCGSRRNGHGRHHHHHHHHRHHRTTTEQPTTTMHTTTTQAPQTFETDTLIPNFGNQ